MNVICVNNRSKKEYWYEYRELPFVKVTIPLNPFIHFGIENDLSDPKTIDLIFFHRLLMIDEFPLELFFISIMSVNYVSNVQK